MKSMPPPPAQLLIIFTRYPEPGKTKTRLIPALGAQGAADFQKQMAEETIEVARELAAAKNLAVEIYFTGGSRELMENWLGNRLRFREQPPGDLGRKMQFAFERGFQQGFKEIGIIGIDCPSLNKSILAEAFDAIKKNDLVIGPAVDGGYYLIMSNQLISELFTGINWGSPSVFKDTDKIARKLNLTVHYLPQLQDIDRPEDLKYAAGMMNYKL